MPPISDVQYKRSLKLREVYMDFFKTVENFVKTELCKAKVTELKYHSETLKNYYKEFLKVQSVIEEFDESEFEYDNRVTVDRLYFNLIPKIDDKLLDIQESKKSRLNVGAVNPEDLNFIPKLPDLTIDIFDGSPDKWKIFIESFNNHIHNNKRLNDMTKFQYLKNLTKGEGARPIESVEFSSENYAEARQLLIERFDKPNLIAEHHIRCLFSYKKIDKPSSSNILHLLDDFNSHTRSLKTLGRPVDYWDDLLVYLMVTKLDSESKSKWRDFAPSDRLPSYNDMSNFLKGRSYKLQEFKIDCSASSSTSSQFKSTATSSKSTRHQRSSFHATTTYHCSYCNSEGHTIMRCYQFIALSVPDRRNAVDKLKLCFNCMRQSHFASKCPSTDSCRNCKTKHHTLLHLDNTTQSNKKSNKNSSSQVHTLSNLQSETTPSIANLPSSSNHSPLNSTSICHNKYILLATAIVDVLDKFGTLIQARALLDSGSQVNFMSSSFASKLGVKLSDSSLNFRGVGCSFGASSKSAVICLKSRQGNYSSKIEVQILPKITSNQPSVSIDTSNWLIPANIKLADPGFHTSQKIDLLLGAEIYYELQTVGQVKLGDNFPFLQNTALGWVVSGKVKTPTTMSCTLNISSSCHETERVDEQLERFWQIDNEQIYLNDNTIFDTDCDKHFVRTHSRDTDGRFVVKLPFLSSSVHLGDSASLALKRFLNLERRLEKNMELRKSYHQFMHEYLVLDHMEIEPIIKNNHYYLPHHCVIKADSSSTRLRVVFDGSAKTSSGRSLNENLMAGPPVQNELFAILIRFRNHAYAISADIAKMYRQVRLHDDDQSYQYIYWRFDASDAIQTYKLKTVTYGTTSAPYLSTRCLLQLAIDSKFNFPTASSAIQRDFYVDDMLSGANSLYDAIELRASVTNILQGAGMLLRKWCANDPAILHDIPAEHHEQMIHIDDGQFVKTLGLFWDCTFDEFKLKVNTDPQSSKVTKRKVISEIAKIFDPIGLVAPVVVLGKMFMQTLWQLKVDWDESLPMQHHSYWLNFRDELLQLTKLSIPRHLFNGCSDPVRIQLHGFADASEKAYGAVLYVRSIINGEVCVRLLCLKSRIAPLKKTTLLRLELCACQLLANMVNKLTQFINFQIDEMFFWSDSTIALSWIKSPSNKWKTYVANRISDIQSKSDVEKWRHVASNLNPADIVSRGAFPNDLLSSRLWWHGPSFLQNNDESWTLPFNLKTLPDELSEVRNTSVVLAGTVAKKNEILTRLEQTTSSYVRFIRIMSYVSRFKFNLMNRSNRSVGALTSVDIVRGTNLVIQLVQIECFPDLYADLQLPNFTVRDSSLKSLSLFIDVDKIIKVGGRLQFSALSYSSKHPALLPNNHYFTLMLVTFFHRKYLHVGPQGLLAVVRQQFWPLNGRQLVKKVCRNCVMCSRARPKLLHQQMAALPSERVSVSPPFYNVGVDYAGPFYVHHRIRGRAPSKTYLSIYVCFATKAVHMELASDMSSASFIGCFRRFIATRGICKQVFSDNGTNFVGANSQLHDLYNLLQNSNLKDDLATTFQQDEIIWKFMPPGSPHFGGLYEAAVKSAKYHLRRMMGTAVLTYEELNTLVKQVEAVLNSRPLMPLASDNEFEVLTPGHFLIGRALVAIPESNMPDDRNLHCVKRWDLVSHLYKLFWSRWSKEYLQVLQNRYYWQDKSRNIPLGSIVLVKDENLPPLKWKMGRVIEVHPGADGLIRVVTLKTATGTIQRSITKVSPLLIDVEPGQVQGGDNE